MYGLVIPTLGEAPRFPKVNWNLRIDDIVRKQYSSTVHNITLRKE